MILSKFVRVTINPSNFKHYTDLGYKDLNVGKIITVLVEHLPKGSSIKIKVKCDLKSCQKERFLSNVNYIKNYENHNTYTCSPKCSSVKTKKTWKNKSEEEIEEITTRIKQTTLEKHGNETYRNIEKSKQTKLKNHGDENFNNPEKNKETMLKNWGVEYPLQSEEVKIKSKETNLERWGVEWTTQSDNMKEKSKETKLERHGDENYNNVEKRIETWDNKTEKEIQEITDKNKATKLKNHGDENYNNREQFLESMEGRWEDRNNKSIETNLKNHGVEFPMQNIVIFNKQQKSAFSLKNYKFPSGLIVKIQGYENLALDLLLKTYDENDLVVIDKHIEQKVGQIWYSWNDGTDHRYYPDIYIISENKIIEVKSVYTFDRDKEKREKPIKTTKMS